MQYQQSSWHTVIKTALVNFYNSEYFVYALGLVVGIILGSAITK